MTETTTTPRTPWGLVILLGAMTAMGAMSIDLYLPSLPSIGASLHATPSETQATVAAFLAGMAIGQTIYGPASDRLGRRPPLLLGIAIYVVASVVCAMATSPSVLIAGRFVEALGACSGAVIARAAVRDQFDHTETARILSFLLLIMGMAPILAPTVGGILVMIGSWRLNFWVMTAFGLAVGAATFFRMRETRSAETESQARQEHPLRSYVALLSQSRLIGYTLCSALNGATLFAYIAESPSLFIKTYGVPPWAFGVLFSINAVGLIGGGQINRQLLRRRTPDQVLARASLIAVSFAVVFLIIALTGFGGRWTVLPLLFCLVATYGFMQGNAMAGALNVDPRRAGSISALMGGGSFGVGAIAAAGAGMLHDGTVRPMAVLMFLSLAGSALATHFLALPKGSLRARIGA